MRHALLLWACSLWAVEHTVEIRAWSSNTKIAWRAVEFYTAEADIGAHCVWQSGGSLPCRNLTRGNDGWQADSYLGAIRFKTSIAPTLIRLTPCCNGSAVVNLEVWIDKRLVYRAAKRYSLDPDTVVDLEIPSNLYHQTTN